MTSRKPQQPAKLFRKGTLSTHMLFRIVSEGPKVVLISAFLSRWRAKMLFPNLQLGQPLLTEVARELQSAQAKSLAHEINYCLAISDW